MIIGNTVLLTHTYPSWTSEAVDVTTPTLKVYEDYVFDSPIETILLTADDRTAVGTYEYYYLVPDGIGDLIFEFSGISEEKQVITRMAAQRSYL